MSWRCRWRSALSATPKVDDAVWFWLRYPREIEYDLRAHQNGLDIGLWHKLTINPDTGAPYLSSRRLLDILEFLPDDGAFKTATRDGQWSMKMQIAAASLNEQFRMRASYHAAHSTKECDVRFDPSELYVIDPAVRGLRDAEAKSAAEEVQHAVDDFNAELGFS